MAREITVYNLLDKPLEGAVDVLARQRILESIDERGKVIKVEQNSMQIFFACEPYGKLVIKSDDYGNQNDIAPAEEIAARLLKAYGGFYLHPKVRNRMTGLIEEDRRPGRERRFKWLTLNKEEWEKAIEVATAPKSKSEVPPPPTQQIFDPELAEANAKFLPIEAF